MINVYSCGSITEAYQKQYRYSMHRRKLSEISATPKPARNSSYESLKLSLMQNRLKRRHHEAQSKLEEIVKSARYFSEKIAYQKRHPTFPVSPTAGSASSTSRSPTRERRIVEENGRIVEKLLLPKMKFPLNPSKKHQLEEYKKTRKYFEIMQRNKQPWKIKFLKNLGSVKGRYFGNKLDQRMPTNLWKEFSKEKYRRDLPLTPSKNHEEYVDDFD